MESNRVNIEWRNSMHTFLNKWVSATVPLLLFFLLFGYFNPHDILVLLIYAAPITYVYGIAMSYFMDWIIRKWEIRRWVVIGLLYALAGALFFIPFFIFIMPTMADIGAFLGFAVIGAGISLVFYLCSLVFRNRRMNWLIAIAIGGPIFLLLMMQIFVFQWETPKKEGWVDERTDTYYEASFDYFHGEQPITMEARKGQKIVFEVTWTELQQGVIGYYSLGPGGEHTSIEELDGRRLAILVQEDGTYQIIVTGKKLKHGSFKVDWEIQTD
jgi:hypothetical protein